MVLKSLLAAVVGQTSADRLFEILVVLPSLLVSSATFNRAHIAPAMNMAVFHDLLTRVPSGRAYVEDTIAAGGKVNFDHGALRTVALRAVAYRGVAHHGSLPSGRAAITRLLEALGFTQAEIYPLPR